jgi:CRP/FNR family transcriptional regulator, cyclic AMP receptor protein
MGSPHVLELTESCQTCQVKTGNFFCNLPGRALKALDHIKFSSGYPKGAVLFTEQESPRGVFILCKGRVKLSMTSSEGKSVILRLADPGEVLGLHAVVSNQP